MAKAIRIAATGGPEQLHLTEVAVPAPGAGEATIRHTAIGVNYIDTYHRSGLYPLPLPAGIGMEAAGVVEAVGQGVSHVRAGDRVVYFANPSGAYATARTFSASALVRLPDAVSDEVAASIWMKACTVEFLVERCANVEAGDRVLVPAAAGGVGVLLCQWLKAKGAMVIGTTGSAAKVAIAQDAGCDHVLRYDEVPMRVRELTDGRGVDCVIDGVGRDSFEASLGALKRRGLMISFGNASGAVSPFAIGKLASGGSLFLTRPTLFDYYATAEDFQTGSQAVLDRIADGTIAPVIGQRFALADAEAAHRALEARETVGSTLLLP